MDSWMLLLDSAKVWEVGEEEKEEAGGRKKDVAAAQGLAEQKGASFLKNRIFPRQSGKM